MTLFIRKKNSKEFAFEHLNFFNTCEVQISINTNLPAFNAVSEVCVYVYTAVLSLQNLLHKKKVKQKNTSLAILLLISCGNHLLLIPVLLFFLILQNCFCPYSNIS